MDHYQVIARRYRPQRFADVLGQEAIITTLKNAIRSKRTAHAYLFCGSKGTGKTTLARLFAKALNCHALSEEGEPCQVCSSCREMLSGNALDILEVDGASNRGIEDVRKINETIGYASATGRYKIYIIDEVHMLTKEAFNALLKTLEEPPPGVKFFFATTEPHKVLPTILSRCQRFNLNRISPQAIVQKLRRVASDLHIEVEEEALQLIAGLADGGLRDAESLFDQILAFHGGPIRAETVPEVLGIAPREAYFQLDAAGAKGDLSFAFSLSEQLFSQGKDLLHFIDGLVLHLRNLLVVKVSGKETSLLNVSAADRARYEQSASFYTQPQLLDLLDEAVEAQARLRTTPSPRIFLEAFLLNLLRSHRRLPLELLVKRLVELEKTLLEKEETSIPTQVKKLGIQPEKPNQPAQAARPQSHYDTLLQFSAIELEGTLEKK